jgi:hypothetical protein
VADADLFRGKSIAGWLLADKPSEQSVGLEGVFSKNCDWQS